MPARFEIPRPTGTDEVDANRPHCAIYRNEQGTLLRWSGRGFPLPEIGAQVRITMNNIGPAEVTGYFEEDGYVGVMTRALNPPEWLRKQRERDRNTPRAVGKPQWWLDGIGCEFGAEIGPL